MKYVVKQGKNHSKLTMVTLPWETFIWAVVRVQRLMMEKFQHLLKSLVTKQLHVETRELSSFP